MRMPIAPKRRYLSDLGPKISDGSVMPMRVEAEVMVVSSEVL